MATVKQVAEYILHSFAQKEENDLTNLKLQKLMYYIQGFNLALNNERLIDAGVEAWQHGPVFPEAYHLYKSSGDSVIPFSKPSNHSAFTTDQIELMDEVIDIYGKYSGWTLRNMTHQESPWLKNESTGGAISDDDLLEFFKTRLN